MLKTFSLGQDIPLDFEGGFKFCLVEKGRLRVLYKNTTLITFEDGCILDLNLLKKYGLSCRASGNLSLLYISSEATNLEADQKKSLDNSSSTILRLLGSQADANTELVVKSKEGPLSTLEEKTEPIESKKYPPFSIEWYLRVLQRDWMLSLQIILATVLIQIFSLGLPFFYMTIFDRVFGHQNLATLNVISTGMILIVLFDLGVKILQALILTHQTQRLDSIASNEILKSVFDSGLLENLNVKTRGLADNLIQLLKTNGTVVSCTLMSTIEIFFAFVLVLILSLMSFPLTLISISPLLPIILYTLWVNSQIQSRTIEFNKDQREFHAKMTEVLDNYEVVKSYNVIQQFKVQLKNGFDSLLEKGFFHRFDKNNGNNFVTFITGLGSLATLYYGAHEVVNGNLSYGIYLAINMLSRNLLGSFQKAFSAFMQFQESKLHITQLSELTQSNLNLNDSKSGGVHLSIVKGEIEFKDVCYTYPNSSSNSGFKLSHINLNIKPGEKVLLAGKSGAGKTTLLKMLQRLIDPASGYIRLDGFALTDMDRVTLRSYIGLVAQTPILFTGSIAENIILTDQHLTMNDVVEASRMTGLDEILKNKFPKDYDTQISYKGGNLSGGEANLIALTRAIARKYPVLILDEALSYVDSTLKCNFLQPFLAECKEKTCIFVSNYLPLHKSVNRIFVLQNGEIVESGSYQELMKAKGYYFHLHDENIQLTQPEVKN